MKYDVELSERFKEEKLSPEQMLGAFYIYKKFDQVEPKKGEMPNEEKEADLNLYFGKESFL